MIRTIDTQAAASLAGTTTAQVRTWCRTGAVAAAKTHGRWHVALTSLLHRLNAHAPRPADHYRPGEHTTPKTGRAARTRYAGTAMSVARRQAVLGALVARINGDRLTAAAYLADALHADAGFIRSYASKFGEAVATAWRAFYGADPKRDGWAWTGRLLVRVFAYSADEMPILDAAADAYPRTAALLAA